MDGWIKYWTKVQLVRQEGGHLCFRNDVSKCQEHKHYKPNSKTIFLITYSLCWTVLLCLGGHILFRKKCQFLLLPQGSKVTSMQCCIFLILWFIYSLVIMKSLVFLQLHVKNILFFKMLFIIFYINKWYNLDSGP